MSRQPARSSPRPQAARIAIHGMPRKKHRTQERVSSPPPPCGLPRYAVALKAPDLIVRRCADLWL